MKQHGSLIKRFNPTQAVLNWLFPSRCRSCELVLQDGDDGLFCGLCFSQLPFQEHSCIRCGQSLTSNNNSCGRCIANPPPFDSCFCAFRYETPIDKLIQNYKYAEHPEYARLLANLLSNEVLAAGLEKPELLIPTPMHKSRLRTRGYNQAALLSNALGQILGIKSDPRLLIKHKVTTPQVELSLAARRNNVRGSFLLRRAPEVKHVAIIDDVLTTGSTVTEMSKVLKQNGVDYIQVWTLAHTT
jgi:ComF family protein